MPETNQPAAELPDRIWLDYHEEGHPWAAYMKPDILGRTVEYVRVDARIQPPAVPLDARELARDIVGDYCDKHGWIPSPAMMLDLSERISLAIENEREIYKAAMCERSEHVAAALTTTPATSEAQTCAKCGHRESRQIPKQCVDDECFCVCVFPDTTPISGPTHRCNGVNGAERHGTQNKCTVCGEYREGWYDSNGMEVIPPAPTSRAIEAAAECDRWCGCRCHQSKHLPPDARAVDGDAREAIDVVRQHDFVLIKGSDRCGLRGCTLGVLEHGWIPPWDAITATNKGVDQ